MVALRFLFLGFALLVLLPGPEAEAETTAPTYVAPMTLPPELLPPPPPENSPEWQEELATIVAGQESSAGLDELGAMRAEEHVRLDLLTDLIGPRFTRSGLPKTFALLDHVLADATIVTEADKKSWDTRRPYMADQHVKLLVDPPEDPYSYPSGHTSEMRTVAEILALLVPLKRDELRARAEEISQHRVDAGVHYSYDLEGGRMLAMLMVGALMRSDTFRQDLAAARDELSHAGIKNQ